MTDTKMFIDSLEELNRLFALGAVSVFEYYPRKAELIKLIDAGRKPVADKALELRGTTGGPRADWLSKVPADRILGLEVRGGRWLYSQAMPFVVDCDQVYLNGRQVFGEPFKIKLAECAGGSEYVEWNHLGEHLAGQISETKLDTGIINNTINISIDGLGMADAINQAVRSVLFPESEACADAAEWLWTHGKPGNSYWFVSQSPQEIAQWGRDSMRNYDLNRQVIADMAQTLHIWFGMRIRPDTPASDIRAAYQAKLSMRQDTADAAAWLIDKGLAAMTWLYTTRSGDIARYYRSRKDRIEAVSTRVTILSLGHLNEGGMACVTLEAPDGTKTEYPLAGKVTEGSGGYILRAQGVQAVTVAGQCDYKVETLYGSALS